MRNTQQARYPLLIQHWHYHHCSARMYIDKDVIIAADSDFLWHGASALDNHLSPRRSLTYMYTPPTLRHHHLPTTSSFTLLFSKLFSLHFTMSGE